MCKYLVNKTIKDMNDPQHGQLAEMFSVSQKTFLDSLTLELTKCYTSCSKRRAAQMKKTKNMRFTDITFAVPSR